MSFYACDACDADLCEECWDCTGECDWEPSCECEVDEADQSEPWKLHKEDRLL